MYITIDVGGTHIQVATFKNSNIRSISKFKEIKTKNNYKKDLNSISDCIKGKDDIEAIAIGLPGILKEDKTGMKLSINLASWMEKNTKKDFETRFDCKNVYIEQDVSLAALAEAFFGKGENEKKFNYIIWGTGIAATAIIRKTKKTYFKQIELGHHITERPEENFDNYKRFALESSIGGGSLVKKYQRYPNQLNTKEWNWIKSKLNVGLFNLQSFYPFETIIFGGGLARKNWDNIKSIEKLMKESLYHYNTPNIKLSRFDNKVGVYGGLALIENREEISQL